MRTKNKKVSEITKDILSDISSCAKQEDKIVDSLSKYFLGEDTDFYCAWPNIRNYLPKNTIILYHLGELALIVKEKTGLEWMTFMIQNPTLDLPAKVYNFGIKKNAMRRSWEDWFNDYKRFNFSRILFLQSLPVQTYSKIFCIRIMRRNNENMGRHNKELITFVINYSKNIPVIGDILCANEEVLGGEKHLKDILKDHIDEIIGKQGNCSFGKLLANYIRIMGSFTNYNENLNYLYAIPVISSFLYTINPSRSALYLPSPKPISVKTLKKIQEIITHPLSHVDYTRETIILEKRIKEQAEKNLEFFRAYEHDTSRFIDLIKLRNINSTVADIIVNRSKVAKLLLGASIKIGVDLKQEQIKKKIRKLLNLIKKQKKVKAYFRLKINSKCNNSYWLPFQIILLNLISNTISNYKKGNSSMVTVTLSKDNSYLVMEYTQQGDFNFEPTAEKVQCWLKSEYDHGTEKGFGHWIIQKIVDRFDGILTIYIIKKRKSYQITKDNITTGKVDSEKQKLEYKIQLLINGGNNG